MYSDLLFPAWIGEGGKLRQQMRDEGGAAAVLLDQPRTCWKPNISRSGLCASTSPSL